MISNREQRKVLNKRMNDKLEAVRFRKKTAGTNELAQRNTRGNMTYIKAIAVIRGFEI